MPIDQNTINLANDILIVDDEIANLKLLSQFLAQEGYQIRAAERSQLAIDSALAQPPALILLDVRMPQMDGFEVCRRLKQDERTMDIPIIFISALQDVEDKLRGFEAGGVDFISKPFQEREVLARVRTHMELRDMQLNLEELVARRTADLAESEAKYRGLVDNALVGVFTSTTDGRFLFANEAMARMFDFDSVEQMVARGSLVRWNDAKDREQMLEELRKKGRADNFEAETITNTGRHIWVLFSAQQIGNDIIGMMMDITNRKQAENRIAEYQKRLKALAFQATIAEEKERRAIAADLHDYVGQSLALARMQIATLKNAPPGPDLPDKLDDVSETLLKALEDTQTLMLELSAHSMHDTGLSTAISDWLEGDIKKHGIETEIIDNISENKHRSLSSEIRTILFRNVRELVINAVKHAKAKKVSIRLEDREQDLRIIVADDGVGFNTPDAFQTGHKYGGFGLFRIEELMTDIGGDLKIVSGDGTGTTAILSVPFMHDDDGREG